MESMLARAQSVLARWWAARQDARLARVVVEADAARDGRQWAEAAQLYRQVALEHSQPFAFWVQCGNCTKEMGDRARAEEAYLLALALDPRSSDLHLQLGHLRKLQGRTDEAMKFYREAFAIDGNTFAVAELSELARQEQKQQPAFPLSWSHAASAAEALGLRTAERRAAGPVPAERRAAQLREALLSESRSRARAGRLTSGQLSSGQGASGA